MYVFPITILCTCICMFVIIVFHDYESDVTAIFLWNSLYRRATRFCVSLKKEQWRRVDVVLSTKEIPLKYIHVLQSEQLRLPLHDLPLGPGGVTQEDVYITIHKANLKNCCFCITLRTRVVAHCLCNQPLVVVAADSGISYANESLWR